MYINKIDELIDNTINDFYLTIINDKNFTSIIKESNFVKYQKDINEIMINYTNKIDKTMIKELFKKSESVNVIFETLKRYVAYFLFLYIGFNYQNREETYINNIVEFSKNQPEYNYKIDNYFNSENNSQVIKFYKMIKQTLTIVELVNNKKDTHKRDIIVNKPEYKEIILFLKDLGQEYIQNNFINITENKNKNININNQAFNIIKTFIVIFLYKNQERKELYRLLEIAENIDGEYMFIDIVVSSDINALNYNSIENLLDKKEIVQGLAKDIWTYLMETEQEINNKKILTVDDKILNLINNKIIVPITDEFLLYHKESELYDRNIDVNKIKKKEDTKIKYIINKIDLASDLYAKNKDRNKDGDKDKIKKQFYQPLAYRKAVIFNEYEDMRIISKFSNLEKISAENFDMLNDLKHYKLYPYINFRDIADNAVLHSGFSLVLNKTINIVRSINFENKTINRKPLQIRIGSNDMLVNIVGFAIPTNTKPLSCLKNNNFIDIKSLDNKNKNGVELVLKYLKKSFVEQNIHKSSVYWLFNKLQDKIENVTVEQNNKNIIGDDIKIIIGYLHDMLIEQIIYKISNKFDNKNKQHIFILQQCYKYINKINKLININKVPDIKNRIDDILFRNIVNYDFKDIKYDIKDDIVYGLFGNKNNKKIIEKNNKINILKINLNKIDESGQIINLEKVEGVCQHNITWDKISNLKHTNPKKYMDDIYTFIQQYVTENVEQFYVCKSCGFYLNIKKYISDGVFDEQSGKFIPYSVTLETPLEEILEYEKYKNTIRYMDKLLEKMSVLTNISYFSGNAPDIRWRRRNLIKQIIDLILINNIKLKKNFKERNENASKKYAINRDMSNLFVFELDNNIFIFSSKDKDQYKPIKQNNITAYIIFLLILELNESQISYIIGDKKGFCNFAIFDKIYLNLFANLKFLKNNKGDVVNVINYKMFCYVLYIIACTLSKYNIWYHDYKDPSQKKKLMPLVQKILVHSVIDIINSVLENNNNLTEKEKIDSNNYIYEVVVSKFYNKLNSTFSDEELYKRFKENIQIINKTSSNSSDNTVIIHTLTGKYTENIYTEQPIFARQFRRYRPYTYFLKYKYIDYSVYDYINNMTNCEDGKFHNWKFKDGKTYCSNCEIVLSELKRNINLDAKIITNNKYFELNNLMNYYKKTFKTYTNKELDDFSIKLNKTKNLNNSKLIDDYKKEHDNYNKNNDYNIQLMDKITKKYENNIDIKNKYNFIDNFIIELENILGNTSNNTHNIYLRDNVYIIDHDHNGGRLNKNVTLKDSDKKIFYKANHSFFKTDVIYYTGYVNGKIDVFYDSITKILLGYKEESKDYMLNKITNKKIVVINSVYNKLKLLGYPSEIINIQEYIVKYNLLEKYYIVNHIIRERLDTLKKIIYKFQRAVLRIVYSKVLDEKEKIKYNAWTRDDYINYFTSILDELVDKHKKKLNNMSIQDNKGNHSVFKHWKNIAKILYVKQTDKQIKDLIDNNTIKLYDILNVDKINEIDNSGDILLYYIIEELTKLLKYNSESQDSKIIQINVALFIIDFINILFDNYNEEQHKLNLEIKSFNYMINSTTFINEIQDKIGETTGIYEEYVDEDDTKQELTKEEQDILDNNIEEDEAIDMEPIVDEFGDDI